MISGYNQIPYIGRDKRVLVECAWQDCCVGEHGSWADGVGGVGILERFAASFAPGAADLKRLERPANRFQR